MRCRTPFRTPLLQSGHSDQPIAVSGCFRAFCDLAQAFVNPGNVNLRPHLEWTPKELFSGVFKQENQEIDMVGIIARWGANALLLGMAIMTYAVFVLAK
jgi:hypothetical protein